MLKKQNARYIFLTICFWTDCFTNFYFCWQSNNWTSYILIFQLLKERQVYEFKLKSVCRRYEPLPSYRHLEKGQHLFSESPISDIFWQQHPNKLRYKNKEIRRRVIFTFRKLQNNITCFFVWNTFISNTRLIVDLKYNSLRYQKEFFTDL